MFPLLRAHGETHGTFDNINQYGDENERKLFHFEFKIRSYGTYRPLHDIELHRIGYLAHIEERKKNEALQYYQKV